MTPLVHGFCFTPSLFNLDDLLDDVPGLRSRIRRLLESLDLMGIPPFPFCADPNRALRILNVQGGAASLCSMPNRVTRDFAFCPRRHTQRRWEDGGHLMQMRTSIPFGQDVKFAFRLEGYNWGVNAPVDTWLVGSVARLQPGAILPRERAGAAGSGDASGGGMGAGVSAAPPPQPVGLEAFGWPTHWDDQTIVHLAPGLSVARPYASREGRLCFELGAKSLSNVGFGVSSWLVTPHAGGGLPVAVAFVDSGERL